MPRSPEEPFDESAVPEAFREAIPTPASEEGSQQTGPESICDFCRLPIPRDPVTARVDGRPYVFCTTACRERFGETDTLFSEYHGFRRIRPGVDGLDRDLPQGIPRNSFVLLSGEAGTREDTLGHELLWRRLQRGEPAGLITFTEPPISVVQGFLDMQWNVLPALEAGRLRIIDCFTSRIDDSDRFRRRLNDWNRHLLSLTTERTERVDDVGDPAEVRNKIDTVVDSLSMTDRGALHIDSLTEFGSLVQPVRAYDFIKDLRADICKGRFVPLFGGATPQRNEHPDFPHDLSYVLDGIVDLALDDSVIENTLVRRMRVRKMNGVLAITEWKAYEFTAGRGLVTFDPYHEIEKRRSQPDGPAPTDGHSY